MVSAGFSTAAFGMDCVRSKTRADRAAKEKVKEVLSNPA